MAIIANGLDTVFFIPIDGSSCTVVVMCPTGLVTVGIKAK